MAHELCAKMNFDADKIQMALYLEFGVEVTIFSVRKTLDQVFNGHYHLPNNLREKVMNRRGLNRSRR